MTPHPLVNSGLESPSEICDIADAAHPNLHQMVFEHLEDNAVEAKEDAQGNDEVVFRIPQEDANWAFKHLQKLAEEEAIANKRLTLACGSSKQKHNHRDQMCASAERSLVKVHPTIDLLQVTDRNICLNWDASFEGVPDDSMSLTPESCSWELQLDVAKSLDAEEVSNIDVDGYWFEGSFYEVKEQKSRKRPVVRTKRRPGGRGAFGAEKWRRLYNGLDLGCAVQKLQPNTSYHFRLVASLLKENIGVTRCNGIVCRTFTTLCKTPRRPQLLRLLQNQNVQSRRSEHTALLALVPHASSHPTSSGSRTRRGRRDKDVGQKFGVLLGRQPEKDFVQVCMIPKQHQFSKEEINVVNRAFIPASSSLSSHPAKASKKKKVKDESDKAKKEQLQTNLEEFLKCLKWKTVYFGVIEYQTMGAGDYSSVGSASAGTGNALKRRVVSVGGLAPGQYAFRHAETNAEGVLSEFSDPLVIVVKGRVKRAQTPSLNNLDTPLLNSLDTSEVDEESMVASSPEPLPSPPSSPSLPTETQCVPLVARTDQCVEETIDPGLVVDEPLPDILHTPSSPEVKLPAPPVIVTKPTVLEDPVPVPEDPVPMLEKDTVPILEETAEMACQTSSTISPTLEAVDINLKTPEDAVVSPPKHEAEETTPTVVLLEFHEIYDPTRKRYYYWNRKDGSAQWTNPEQYGLAKGHKYTPKKNEIIKIIAWKSWEPGGWIELFDNEARKTYYYTTRRKMSAWQLPEGVRPSRRRPRPPNNDGALSPPPPPENCSWARVKVPSDAVVEYFLDTNTGESVWDLPHALKDQCGEVVLVGGTKPSCPACQRPPTGTSLPKLEVPLLDVGSIPIRGTETMPVSADPTAR
jgi:hypothetical protein